MKKVIIETLVLKLPYDEEIRKYRQFTDEILAAHRISSYFMPITQPWECSNNEQMVFDTEWTKNRLKKNEWINKSHARVCIWREGAYAVCYPSPNQGVST